MGGKGGRKSQCCLQRKGKKSFAPFRLEKKSNTPFSFRKSIFNTLVCTNIATPLLPVTHFYYFFIIILFVWIIMSFLLSIVLVNMVDYNLKMQQWWAISHKGIWIQPTQQSEDLEVYFNPKPPCGNNYKSCLQHPSLVLLSLH